MQVPFVIKKLFEMEGISNKTIVIFFVEKTNDDIKKILFGVFPSNYVIRIINFCSMMIESKSNYPFIIMNTDRSDKKGTHCCSFLDLHTNKELFLFDSFGFEGFEEFILDNDKNILNKILYGTEKFDKKDNNVTVITLKFSMLEYEKIRKKRD